MRRTHRVWILSVYLLIVAGITALAALATPGSYCATAALDTQRVDIEFDEVSIEDGLSQSIVECIVQDRRGFMWFGTEDGLNKYDGYEFTIMRHDPDDPTSLSHNHLQALCEDRKGLIWVGTFNGGLNSYNPFTGRFKVYRLRRDDPRSINHDCINTLYVTSDGVLWIGTNNGLNRYNRESDDFTRYGHDPQDPHSIGGSIVRDITEDRSGMLWIAMDDGGLNRFDRNNGQFHAFLNDPRDPSSLSANAVRTVYVDKTDVLWAGTVGGGLNRFERDTETFTHFTHDPSNPYSISHDQVYAIYEDLSGSFWIGTNGGGLNILDRKTGRFYVYRNDPNDPATLSYDEIYDIYEDRSGVIWLGTYGGGANKFDRNRKKFTTYCPNPDNPNSLSAEIVWSIYEDEDGILWIGTHGGGLNRFDRRTGRYTHYRHDPDDPSSVGSDIVRLVYVDRSGVFWIGTNGGGLNRFDRNTGLFERFMHDPNDPASISHDELRYIYEDRRGVLWIGTNGGGLNRFDRASETFMCYQNDPDDLTSLCNDYVRVMHEDRKGNFWIGTQGGGLEKFDRDAGTFMHFQHDPDNQNSLSNDFVFSIHEDKAGILWLGTWGGGLTRFDPGKETFKHYTEKDGLPSNSIYGLLADNQGNFWISTNNGLSKFNPETGRFKHYTEEDGLQSNEFNGNAFFKSRSGEMFFGGIRGFNAFFPEEIKDNPFVPPVVITSFLKLNKKVKLDSSISEMQKLTLSHKDYVFSFEFASLDFTAPQKNTYAYKMEKLDEEWIYTDAGKRFATYTTLAPGRYLFRVKGTNNDGIWNDKGTAIELVITPPIWRTIWFQALAILIVFGLGIFLYQRRLRNVRMAAELRAAHTAQMSIMPSEDPDVPGFDISGICIPANEVGGDFYEYFWLKSNHSKFGVAVGDVSGKAMSAAMIAVMSSGMIYLRAAEDGSTSDIMTQLNNPIYSKTNDFMFTTLYLTSLDTETKEMAFTNAGFNSPLLKSNGSVRSLESVGARLPLGAIENTLYEETRMHLNKEDVLVIFSDGIPDSRNKNKEFYDPERLIRLLENIDSVKLTAHEIKEQIIDDVMTFSSNTPQNDDITVVVIKSI